MKIFDYIQRFAFKNFYALLLTAGLLYLLNTQPGLRDIIVILLTLVVKYYFDTSNSSSKKDETIQQALTAAQQSPAVGSSIVTNADAVNVK